MANTRAATPTLLSAILVPWNAFVGAFLYYVLLTLLAIGVANLATAFVVISYLLPLLAYAALIGTRAIRALAALPIDLGETPHALQQ
jgi:hypothetical protein